MTALHTPVHWTMHWPTLAADGTVMTAVYCSGAVRRLVPEDVVGLLTSYARQHS